MKQLYFLFLFIPTSIFCQIQVSDIDYQLPRDDYDRKGFVKIGQDEYFIEQGYKGTMVWQVEDDKLSFLHEVKYRPTDSPMDTYIKSYENSNSGLIHNGSILFEFYRNYIYSVDILTNELVEVIDLNEYGIELNHDFHFGENFFFFNASGLDGYPYVRIDRNTGVLETLPDNGVVVDGMRYWMSEDGNALTYRNLETNETGMLSHSFANIQSISNHFIDDNSKLIIEDDSGIYLLRNDDSIYSLSCGLPENGKLKYVSDRSLAYSENDGSELTFSIVDLQDCNVVYTDSYAVNSDLVDIWVFADEQLFDEYFMFGFTSDWQGNGLFYLYNIETKEANMLDLPIDFPNLVSSVRYGDGYYFHALNSFHYIGVLPELFRLDLKTLQVQHISDLEIWSSKNIVIGEPQDDEELSVFYRIEDASFLSKFSEPENSLTQLTEFDLYKNHGIHYSIYTDTWIDDKYFFSASESIFVMENNATTKVLDIGPNQNGSSAYQSDGDHVYVLSGMEDGYYAIKININDLSYTKIALPGVDYIYYKRYTSENAIINLRNGSAGSKGFFDINTETFVSFEDLGLANGIGESVSGNMILYQTYSSNGGEWYLINTVTREVTLTEIEPGTFPDPYPDDKGGFYLDGWRYGTEVNFMYLDEQGKVSTIYEDFSYSLFYDGDKTDGEVKSLAFDAPDDFIIISAKNGEVRQKSIPDNGLLYYQSFYWYESDQASYLELYNGNNYDTYRFTFETSPEIITPSGREDRLLTVIEEDAFAVLVYKDDNDMLSFEKYDYEIGSFEQVAEVESVQHNAIVDNPLKISDSKYLISIKDELHGNEPWIFDVNTGELQLLKDMRSGLRSSNINDFTRNPINGDLYFSAIKSENDRQLFVMGDTTGLIEIDPENEYLTIYPVPSNSEIMLMEDFKKVLILRLDGKIVRQFGPYIKGSGIPVDELSNGVYIVKAIGDDNSYGIGKIVVQH